MSQLSLTYSIADQHFARTDSIGILNQSVQMAQGLAERLELQMTVLSNSGLRDRLKLPPRVPVTLHDSAVRSMLGRIKWDQWGAYAAAARLGNKSLMLPKGYASFLRACPVHLVTCVNDTSFDYYRRHYPGTVPPLRQWYFDSCVRGTIKHSDLIFTNSDFSGTEILRLAKELGLKAPPVQTIGIGFYPQQNHYEKKPRIMVLASALPHKRTELAIDYLTRWQQKTDFAGTVEWVGRFPSGVKPPELPRWRAHSRLPDAEYKQLKGEAQALVYFSEYEGFGMPPVEATIAGACPVYSDLPATREVMRGAGFPFENTSFESFERALNQALRVSREQVEFWGAELLRRHSWTAVADRVVRGLMSA